MVYIPKDPPKIGGVVLTWLASFLLAISAAFLAVGASPPNPYLLGIGLICASIAGLATQGGNWIVAVKKRLQWNKQRNDILLYLERQILLLEGKIDRKEIDRQALHIVKWLVDGLEEVEPRFVEIIIRVFFVAEYKTGTESVHGELRAHLRSLLSLPFRERGLIALCRATDLFLKSGLSNDDHRVSELMSELFQIFKSHIDGSKGIGPNAVRAFRRLLTSHPGLPASIPIEKQLVQFEQLELTSRALTKIK